MDEWRSSDYNGNFSADSVRYKCARYLYDARSFALSKTNVEVKVFSISRFFDEVR